MKVDTLDKNLVAKIIFAIASSKDIRVNEDEELGCYSNPNSRAYRVKDKDGNTTISLIMNDYTSGGNNALYIYDNYNHIVLVKYEEEPSTTNPKKVNGGEKNPKAPKSPITQIEEAFIKRYNALQHEKNANEKAKKEKRIKESKESQRAAQASVAKMLENVFGK